MVKDALLHYLQHPKDAVAVLRNPIGPVLALHERMLMRFDNANGLCSYTVEPRWNALLHAAIGRPANCAAAAEFEALWPAVLAELRAQGLKVGPASFYGWNDGDPAMLGAIWCLVRHLEPERVVETGVARGLTSRIILEALARNGRGELWSIDLPPVKADMRAQVGAAVTESLRGRWSYIAGPSRQMLPGLLRRLGRIDLFVHDSQHSTRNVRFELDLAWRCLPAGSFAVVDDIDTNWGFHLFAEAHPECRFWVCQSEPIAPDPRRPDQRGLFGIGRKH